MQNNMYDLTTPQKLIWFTEEVFKGTSIGNITGTVIIPNKVNFAVLEQAINFYVEKNDSFRLRFIMQNNQLKQYVEVFNKFHIDIIKVNTNQDLKKVEDEIVSTVFDVFNSLLFKFIMLQFPDGHGGFIINMHHLISDAWSAGLGASEIIKIYTCLLKNESIDVITYPSYIDYINSEQEYMASQRFDKDKTFWVSSFKSVPETTFIPGSVALKDNSSFIANREQFTISKTLLREINELCKKHKFSIFNFFMSVFAIYIGKVSSLDEFVIGTPILNRSNIKEKHTSGMFVSTVPLKINLGGNIRFAELASTISSKFFNIFKHQKYSYVSLLKELRNKDNTIPNLYNTLISYQNIRSSAQTSEIPYEINWVPSKYISDDIDIHIYDMNDTGNVNIAYDYQISKYSKIDIINIHKRIVNIINQILKNSNIAIDDIEIVTHEEKNKILFDFNNTKQDYSKDKTITELFEEQVKKASNNTALVFENKSMTYSELNKKANSLAHYLRSKGITPNDAIGIMVNRSFEMIIAILAVLKAGGAYVPIDPEYPQDRVQYMLDNSNAKFLLTFKRLAKKINFKNKIFIELSNNFYYEENTQNLPNINTPQDLAYIIYTSGSTGDPKGVMLKHQNINNFICGTTNIIDFSPYKTIVSITTISFDIFVLETLLPLQKGLKVVIANENEQNDPKLFNNLCIQNNVNMIQTTPSRFQVLISDSNSLDYMKNVTDILVGGETFPDNLLTKLQSISGAKIYNMYGPTETTVWSTIKDLTHSNQITIGTPISNTQVYVLDSKQHLLPPYVPGNLYIGGDGLAKGYYMRDDLTKEKFVDNKYIKNNLIYNTGDLVYFNYDGELVHLGRSDFQVKIRGYRIELGEIEKNISLFDGILQNVVVGIDNKLLVCYYTSNTEINISNLVAFLMNKLPDYMIPVHFQKVEEFPYTPNGKIDRKKLPAPNLEINKKIVPARNSTDKILIELCKQLLDIDSVSITDNFFYLGGDSLTAINLCALIQDKFKISLLARDILEHPIISELSNIIASKLDTRENVNIPIAKKTDFYPLSSAQKRMYLSSTMSGKNSTLYNIPGGIVMYKMPDIAKLETCLNVIISRHEALRTSFEIVDNNIVQKIHNSFDFKLEISKETISLDELKTAFYDFVKPFDLAKAPLFRAKLIKLKENKVALLVDMHHIISDGTSLHIFINELCKLYNNQALDKLNISYKDFAVWENNRLASGDFKEAEDFWVNQFKDDIPVLNMPINYLRPAVKSFAGNKVYFKFDKRFNC